MSMKIATLRKQREEAAIQKAEAIVTGAEKENNRALTDVERLRV